MKAKNVTFYSEIYYFCVFFFCFPTNQGFLVCYASMFVVTFKQINDKPASSVKVFTSTFNL